jgi:hypothetical protein
MYGATMPLVLVITHYRIQAIDTVTILHLPICNKRGQTLSTRRYSARLTHLKLKSSDTKDYARLSFSGLADSFAKSIS